MRKLFVYIILLFLVTNSFAGLVEINKAKIVAVNFYKERALKIDNFSSESIKITKETIVTDKNNLAVYYIFTIGNEKGYILVSAESNVTPVLAYSFEVDFPYNKDIPALNWITNSYKNEIENARVNNIIASPEIAVLWATYSNSNKSTSSVNQVLPILGTINWDQSCYYNALCPANTDQAYCNHNPTGCVATAMAQIIKYNAYPTTGSGSYSYNHLTANGYSNNYGTLSANFAATTYNYSAMPNVVNSANNSVATLMSHCGIAVGMSYDANGSGAIVGSNPNYQGPTAEKALKTYFKYSTAKYYKKSGYTNSQWQALILSDVDASRPILYAGDDGSAGHAFVLDGYQGTTNSYHYHFNFGWSGSGNGYFYIDTINPGSGGVGGGSYNFSTNEEGIFSIVKSTAGIGIQEKTEIEIYPNPSNGSINLRFSNLNESNVNIKVLNLLGEMVFENIYSYKVNNLTIDLSNLSKGVYFININTKSNQYTKKISIVK